MSCTDVNDDIFVSLDTKELDHADLIELVSNATLRRSPSPKMCIQLTPPTSRCTTRAPSPLDPTFSALGDPDSIVTQITLINGEKIWVREEVPGLSNFNSDINRKTGDVTSTLLDSSSISPTSMTSVEDCNSSTDSINISVPLFVNSITSDTDDTVLSSTTTCSEMMDLQTLLQPDSSATFPKEKPVKPLGDSGRLQINGIREPFSISPATPSTSLLSPTSTTPSTLSLVKHSLPQTPAYVLSSMGSVPSDNNSKLLLVKAPITKADKQDEDNGLKTGSLLRSALTGKTSFVNKAKTNVLNNNTNTAQIESKPTLSMTTMPQPRAFTDKPSPQKVEEIILLAMKKTGTLDSGIGVSRPPQTTASTLSVVQPPLTTLIPVNVQEDGNNNLKRSFQSTSGPPSNVISLVLDVNQAPTRNINLLEPALPTQPHPLIEDDDDGSESRLKKIRKSKDGEPTRKESRLLHYCHICNKGFKDRYSVNVHVRTHTGEKPFSCPLCGKCFRQKAHLAKHHQTHAAKQQTGSTLTVNNATAVAAATPTDTLPPPPPYPGRTTNTPIQLPAATAIELSTTTASVIDIGSKIGVQAIPKGLTVTNATGGTVQTTNPTSTSLNTFIKKTMESIGDKDRSTVAVVSSNEAARQILLPLTQMNS